MARRRLKRRCQILIKTTICMHLNFKCDLNNSRFSSRYDDNYRHKKNGQRRRSRKWKLQNEHNKNIAEVCHDEV